MRGTWIVDSSHRGYVELWSRGGRLEAKPYHPRIYLHMPDPHRYREMLEELESRFSAEECTFKTIYGQKSGYSIRAQRKTAEAIEIQTMFSAEFYNLDLRADQRYMAEKGIFPCGFDGESRFQADFEMPISVLEMSIPGDPGRSPQVIKADIAGKRLEGNEREVIEDLLGLVKVHNPDMILFPGADGWMQVIASRARRLGLEMEMAGAFSRSDRFRTLAARSYWSYGQACHRDGAMLPDGRALIDTQRRFVYREGGLKGVILASRLSGLPPNLSSRFTPGTLVSSYEVYEALTRGIAVPFRKRDAECMRKLPELRSRDKGGLILQPEPGLEERVFQIDFTSMYPTIIVNYNLSPESLDRRVDGFLAQVIRPLLNLRLITKGLKKSNREYAGLDSVLKWMLVTCFGYTGYRNARFGSIEVHERITGISREVLMQAKEISESMGFLVLHGIVDCLFVKGEGIEELERRIESQTGIGAEVESYNWIAFLPQKGGRGAYNRYFGRLVDGKMKVRGIAARRSDTPEYVRRMQQEVLDILAKAGCSEEISALEERAAMARQRYLDGLNRANPKEMSIKRRLSQLSYKKACPEASAVKAAARSGEALAPGMEVEYVIADARGWSVCLSDQAEEFDATYYQKLLDKAWEDMEFAFRCARLRPHVSD